MDVVQTGVEDSYVKGLQVLSAVGEHDDGVVRQKVQFTDLDTVREMPAVRKLLACFPAIGPIAHRQYNFDS